MVLEQTDKELIEDCRRGQQDAYRALFEKYKDTVYSVALRFSGDAAIAQDIAQETFLKLFSALDSFRGDSNFESWLYRLVVNCCFDHKRRARRWTPLLDELLEGAAEHKAEQAILGMSHRGRLNVMVHVVGRSPAEIFGNFEDVDPRTVLGGGDVKYHMGATGEYTTESGHSINIHLVSNPSHLEAVDPVVLGRTRAKQVRSGENGAARFLPIVMHGDAAFAGNMHHLVEIVRVEIADAPRADFSRAHQLVERGRGFR